MKMKKHGIYHHGPISGVAVSATHVATASYDRRVILWELASGRALATVSHDDLVNQCEFSPDGRLLATASSDGSMRLYDVSRRGLRLRRLYMGHADDVMQVRFSPCGTRIATCSYDGSLHVLDLEGTLLARCIGHTALVERFCWRPSGAGLLSCGTDGSICAWDATTGACIEALRGLPCDVDDACYLTDDAWLAGADDGRFLIFEDGALTAVPAHAAGIKCLARTGDRLLSVGYDQRYRYWALDGAHAPRLLAEGPLCDQAWARSACLLEDGRAVFASFGSRYLELDLATGRWKTDGYVPSPSLNAVCAHTGVVRAIGDAGRLLVDGRDAGGVGSLCNALAVVGDLTLAAGQAGVVFDAVSGERLHEHTAPINALVALERGGARTHVVLAGYDGMLVRLSFEGRAVADQRALRIGETAVKGVAVRDGRLFCGLADGTLVIVDADTFRILHRRTGAHDAILNGVSHFEHGFVSVSRDLTMRRWRPDGEPIDTVATRHLKSIKCCASSPDGRYTASGSYAGTVDVYDHAHARWVGEVRRVTERGVSSLAWCQRRGEFLAAGYDGNVYEVATHDD